MAWVGWEDVCLVLGYFKIKFIKLTPVLTIINENHDILPIYLSHFILEERVQILGF